MNTNTEDRPDENDPGSWTDAQRAEYWKNLCSEKMDKEGKARAALATHLNVPALWEHIIPKVKSFGQPDTSVKAPDQLGVLRLDGTGSDSDFELSQESGSCWIAIGNISVYVIRTDEGVVVDLFPRMQEMAEPLASTYASSDEAQAVIDEWEAAEKKTDTGALHEPEEEKEGC